MAAHRAANRHFETAAAELERALGAALGTARESLGALRVAAEAIASRGVAGPVAPSRNG